MAQEHHPFGLQKNETYQWLPVEQEYLCVCFRQHTRQQLGQQHYERELHCRQRGGQHQRGQPGFRRAHQASALR